MRERTVLASFYSEPEAQQAASQIHAMGVEVAQIDELHAYGGVTPNRRFYPISGDIPSLAELSLNAQVLSKDASVLLAADPAASGMADGRSNITGRNYLLTVICPEPLVDKAVQVIRTANGYT